ncbi:fibronectin type III domain-containing protein [Tautonia plasticadhaerens]|uniref:Fibronectin type-III domain-containing protein n=1 Tax=Tautonia plasticadhaerens TaxID=2527974 RepID=A0A518H7I5_9BACT|nr:fibronectin type III domain-containing protein [Tautonia plasticadhaerens]QDV36820.1 hypothetical protein ElP_47490 [Tautonia plasticadhaerens]
MVADYYEMLGIPQGADRAAVEEALARCQPKWSAGARNPKHRHTYHSYLDQIPAIRATLLGDPTARASYDAELAALRRAELDRKLDEIQRLVRLRASKGGLTVSDRDRLRREADRIGVPAEELDRLLEPIAPMPEAPAEADEPDEPTPDVIDSATRGQIRRTLEHLGRRDLYDALGLQRDAPQAEVVSRADDERRRWRQKSRVTAEMTAWLEAVSYAQSHLGTPGARARYDRTLEFEAEERFLGAVRFCLEGEARLASGAKAALVVEGESLGIGPDRADRLIRRACRGMGVASGEAPEARTEPAGPIRLLRCRSCRGVTQHRDAEKNGRACRHCGDSLRWECPICKRGRWVDEPRCACGFRLELREPMLRHFEAARRAHKARDYASALAHLHRIQEFAPDHAGTRKAVERVKQRLSEIERARSGFEQELSRRHLLKAQSALRAWASMVDPTDPEVRKAFDEVNRGLREARSLSARGSSLLGSDPAEARTLLRRALEWSADLDEARDALRRCPPDPPTDLRAEVERDAVVLRWTPPAPDGLGPVSIRVVRKARGVPASPADGTVIAETDATECRDPAASPGEVVGYAAFGRRDGVDSVAPAVVGPVLVLADVQDVRVDARSGEVGLSWRLPRGATGVRVARKQGSPPTGPDDGVRVDALPDGAGDRGLDDDRVYHYRIFACYRTPEGKERLSRGVSIAAMPHPPVSGLISLVPAPMPDGRVHFSWEEPERGQVKILRSDRPPALLEGQRIPAGQADALEGHWLATTATDHAVDARPPTSGLCYYTPFTFWAGTCAVGRPVASTRIPDPSELRAVRIGGSGRVHLRWRWSPATSQSLVLLKAGAPADGPDDPAADRLVVSELEYGRQGFAPLDLPPGEVAPYHITVLGLAEVDGRILHSPGVEPTARTVVPGPSPEVSVSYSIRRPRLPGRPWALAVQTDPPGSPVPPMVLVGHPRTVPLTADDGELIAAIPSGRGGDSFRIPPVHRISDFRLRLFVDPTLPIDQIPPIRLRHPEAERTRV